MSTPSASATAPTSGQPESLKGKVAIVTGGSRGIGAAIAKELGRLGARVVVNYNGNEAAAAEVVAAIKGSGSDGVAVRGDVSKASDVTALFEEAEKRFGRVNIVVNNAGVLLRKDLASVTEEDFDLVVGVNLKGAFFVLRESARRVTDGGRIINVSSTATRLPFPGFAVYSATKAALEQISRVLAAELGSRQITVNSVLPGPVDTDMYRASNSVEELKQLVAISPLGRVAETADIVGPVVFLASEAAGWVTGQSLGLNGGLK